MQTTSPARQSSFQLYDRILGGKLLQVIEGLRAEGLSCDRIARRLEADHDIVVAGTTVYRWLKRAEAAAQ